MCRTYWVLLLVLFVYVFESKGCKMQDYAECVMGAQWEKMFTSGGGCDTLTEYVRCARKYHCHQEVIPLCDSKGCNEHCSRILNSLPSAKPGEKVMTIDDIFNPALSVIYPNLRWSGKGAVYTQWGTGVEDCYLLGFEAADNTKEVILTSAEITGSGVQDLCNAAWIENPDLKLIAIQHSVDKRYRHSYSAKYQIFDKTTSAVKSYDAYQGTDKIMLLNFAPSGTKRAMVINGGVTICDGESDCRNVTPDAKYDETQYGLAGWLYEEEVLATDNAMWWSPDGNTLAMLRFDLTKVPYYTIVKTPENLDDTASSYPTQLVYHYPLSGATNPVVQLNVYKWNDAEPKLIPIDIPQLSNTVPWYVYNVRWTSSTTLSIEIHDRPQTTRIILIATVHPDGTITTKTVDTLTVQDTEWVREGTHPIYYSAENFLILDVNNDYFHIRRVENGQTKFLTSGDWTVTTIYGIDSEYVYYCSTQNDPKERHIFRLKFAGTDHTPQELTALSTKAYYSASFSSDMTHFVLRYMGPGIPVTTVRASNDPTKQIRVLADNAALSAEIKEYSLPWREFEQFTSADGKTKLEGEIWYPNHFDDTVQYPVLIYVYGGPASQEVSQKFRAINDWKTFMGSNQSYVVVSFDGRGTGFRSASFMYQVKHNLGIKESEDVIAVVEQLKAKKWVNPNRITMFGWSYGGYLTLMSTSLPNEATKQLNAAISVAPVTSWRLYDSAYTERYMGIPSKDDNFYDITSVQDRIANIKSRVMIVHGAFDDNVHFTNSKSLVYDMVNAEIQFDVMYYPNKDHGISGTSTRKHLWTKLTEFLHLHNCVQDCTLQ